MGFRFLNEHGQFVKGKIKGYGESKAPAAKPKPEVKPEEVKVDDESLELEKKLSDLNMSELRKIAKEKGIEIPKSAKKGEILDAIELHESNKEELDQDL